MSVDNSCDRKYSQSPGMEVQTTQSIIEKYTSSSEEDEEELDQTNIIKSLYQHYSTRKEDEQLLIKTTNYLENVLQSGAHPCLICIASIKRIDAIWSCKYCYCFFHLNCIRRWANDSIAQAQHKVQNQASEGYYNFLGEFIPPKKPKPLHWCCPQCRREFSPEEKPQEYKCFCGKEINPVPQAWLVPHSCGELCGKDLQPNCGHKCNILCHPGPCPPCAQYVVTSCKCEKSIKKSVRCLEKEWECNQKCILLLPCGQHVCGKICHKPNQCPPCTQLNWRSCECGRESMQRQCWGSKYHCKQVCGKLYPCGLHTCKTVCHSGDCGQCPLSMPRSCPCGKTKKVAPCSEVIDTCGDTCQKVLDCGQHTCTQRCHKGSCNLCLLIVKKTCRCGQREKELPCSKEFTCETKCKQIRDCGKHPCNRKCCDRKCPPCDKVCGKPLSCGKHKCQSICHKGPCYPCRLQSQVNCSCGKTRKSVPCGRERLTRVACKEPCRIPSKCHHINKHRCHKHECPPCVQICGLPNDTTGCSHFCTAKCHNAIKYVSHATHNETKNIWKATKVIEYKTLPHPKCEEKVTVMCLGGHEIIEAPCWDSKPSSCRRLCNRQLSCGNHKCSLVCHSVPDPNNMNAQEGCDVCETGCTIPRPVGCTHKCPKACHPPPCRPCSMTIKTKCHCGLMEIICKCCDFYISDDNATQEEINEKQNRLKSCGNRCLKNYGCGHRCVAKCHPGPCPNPEQCRKKLRIYCTCKRLKQDISCDKYRSGFTQLECDEACAKAIEELNARFKAEEELLRKQEAEYNRLEIERFERKFSKRNRTKEFKKNEVKDIKPINWKLIMLNVGILCAIILAVVLAFYEEK